MGAKVIQLFPNEEKQKEYQKYEPTLHQRSDWDALISPEAAFCNKCGALCAVGDQNFGLSTIIEGNKHTVYLCDGTVYRFALCERCSINLIGDFIFPPESYEVK
jgi:hypothetical protein